MDFTNDQYEVFARNVKQKGLGPAAEELRLWGLGSTVDALVAEYKRLAEAIDTGYPPHVIQGGHNKWYPGPTSDDVH